MSNGTMPDWTIHGPQDWRARFASCLEPEQEQPIVFVVGSGLSSTVWNVRRIVDWVEEELKTTFAGDSPADKYGRALDKLAAQKRPPSVDLLIRRAVLAATQLPEGDSKYQATMSKNPTRYQPACADIEEQQKAWKIPQGTRALARAVQAITEKSPNTPVTVLTTNFDPLIEVALDSLGIRYDSKSIVGAHYPKWSAKAVPIWHVHGFWSDVTLHSARALAGSREGLQDAIRDCLNGAEVFVLGYGGWQDVIFDTAVKMLNEGKFRQPPSIAWAFYEPDPKASCQHVLNRFQGGLASQYVNFFAGIDLHQELPDVMGMGADPESSRTRSNAVRESKDLLDLLAAVKKAGPSHRDADFAAFFQTAQRGERINLVRFVGLLCSILDDLQGAARTAFALASQPIVRRLALELVADSSEDVKAVASCVGDVAIVTVRTPLLVEILLARAHHRDPEWLPHDLGAYGKYTLPVEDGFEFEPGNSVDANVRNFEAMIWPQVIGNVGQAYHQTRHRDVLHARLKLNQDEGHPLSVVLRSGSREHWRGVAQEVTTVAFIEMSGSSGEGVQLDEYMLAHRISDFLKKCPQRDGYQP